ncbi:MAG: hypothetical protein ACYDEY_08910 [Acidimicrobiales bacterium]
MSEPSRWEHLAGPAHTQDDSISFVEYQSSPVVGRTDEQERCAVSATREEVSDTLRLVEEKLAEVEAVLERIDSGQLGRVAQ